MRRVGSFEKRCIPKRGHLHFVTITFTHSRSVVGASHVWQARNAVSGRAIGSCYEADLAAEPGKNGAPGVYESGPKGRDAPRWCGAAHCNYLLSPAALQMHASWQVPKFLKPCYALHSVRVLSRFYETPSPQRSTAVARCSVLRPPAHSSEHGICMRS